jgi:hypothetical protein
VTIDRHALTEKKKESLFTAIYIGSLFIILATVYFVNLPNSLWDSIINFFGTLTLSDIPGTSIPLPAPVNPAAHIVLYNAAFQFAIGIGIVEIVILALRIFLYSPVSRKAETVENIVFWLVASYLIATYLVNMTIASEWFVFWAGIILIFGLSLVARAFVILANRYL